VPHLSILWSARPALERLAVLSFGVALVVGGGILRRRKNRIQKPKLAETVDHNSDLFSFDLESIGHAAASRQTAELAVVTHEVAHSVVEKSNIPKETS
jgi:hypothetical protein